MKKRSKIIITITMIVIMITTMVIQVFADQYGTEPYSTNYWENLPTYEKPSTWVTGTNPYTLLIDTTYFNISTFERAEIVLYQRGQTQNENATISITGYDNYLEIDVYYPTTNTRLPTQTIYYGSYAVFIPFYDSQELVYLFNQYNINMVQILNNQQLTTTRNDTTKYQQGYNTGYTQGEQQGYQSGYTNGEIDGYNDGYSEGYTEGARQSADIGQAGSQLIYATVEAPVNVFKSLLNFEILGVNVLGFVTACLSIMLVVAVIKRFV